MEVYVQLKEEDYKQLIEKANMNEEKIKELAFDLYQNQGVAKVEIRFPYKLFKDEKYIPSVYVNSLNSNFPLSHKTISEVNNIIYNKIKNIIEEDFGTDINNFKKYKLFYKNYLTVYTILFIFGIIGWLFVFLFKFNII